MLLFFGAEGLKGSQQVSAHRAHFVTSEDKQQPLRAKQRPKSRDTDSTSQLTWPGEECSTNRIKLGNSSVEHPNGLAKARKVQS